MDTDPTPLLIDAAVALLSAQVSVTTPLVTRVSGLADNDPLGKDGAGAIPLYSYAPMSGAPTIGFPA